MFLYIVGFTPPLPWKRSSIYSFHLCIYLFFISYDCSHVRLYELTEEHIFCPAISSIFLCMLALSLFVLPFLHTYWVIHLFLYIYIYIFQMSLLIIQQSLTFLYIIFSFFLSLRISCQSLLFFISFTDVTTASFLPFELLTSSKRFYFPFTISEYICWKIKSFWSFIW